MDQRETNPLVLLVDDELLPMQYYVRSLTRVGCRVEHIVKSDEALAYARAHANEIDLIVLDLMMPPGNAYANVDTDQGLKTGLFLLRDLRQIFPSLPVIILTNVSNSETLSELPHDVKVCQKLDTPPSKLLGEVQDALPAFTLDFPAEETGEY